MTKLLKSTTTLFGLALLAIGLPALAEPGPGPRDHDGPGGHGPGRGMARMAEKLGLSDAQKTQLQAIKDRYRSGAFGDTTKAFQDARARLEDLIGDPVSTDQQILEAARLVSARGESVAIQRHRMAVEIDSILTPEQRQKAKELKAERSARKRDFHHDVPPLEE
jgi:Spy/CpxP family protein refolding chaperone